VSASLIAVGAWAAGTWLQAALDGAQFSGPIDREQPPNALANMYRTADNRWLLLAIAQDDRDWPAFVQTIGRPDLLQDSRFADSGKRHANAAALVQILDAVFGAKPLDDWRTALDQARIAFGVVQTAQELAHDPQLLANDNLRPIQDGAEPPSLTVDSPLTVQQEQKVLPRPAPDLGQHTIEVLTELGFDAAAIDELRADGAIPPAGGTPRPAAA
jgi:crotonobetainyl-CoA:carnitine CoA-transferase CaiB-like acyl-CoA transferase